MIRDNMPALPKSAERDAKKEAAAEGEKLEEVTDKPDPQVEKMLSSGPFKYMPN